MASISSSSSSYASLQSWQAKQKSFTSTFLNNAAVLSDDIGSTVLTLSQNLATMSGQAALTRIQKAAAAQSAATTSNTADPYAAANASKKINQILNGTDKLISSATSTTDAATTVNQIINGTADLVAKTADASSGDVTKTINQIIAGTDDVGTSNPTGDMMALTKIMYGIDKLPLPPKTDVAT